jgi:hypothetical protein
MLNDHFLGTAVRFNYWRSREFVRCRQSDGSDYWPLSQKASRIAAVGVDCDLMLKNRKLFDGFRCPHKQARISVLFLANFVTQ